MASDIHCSYSHTNEGQHMLIGPPLSHMGAYSQCTETPERGACDEMRDVGTLVPTMEGSDTMKGSDGGLKFMKQARNSSTPPMP